MKSRYLQYDKKGSSKVLGRSGTLWQRDLSRSAVVMREVFGGVKLMGGSSGLRPAARGAHGHPGTAAASCQHWSRW